MISDLVFHRNGKVISSFKRSWDTASKAAGVPGRLFHDLRRTAVRDLVRSGVPQSLAMRITGHKTASVFTRYDITSDTDRRDAMRKLEAYRASKPVASNVVALKSKDGGAR